MHFTPFQEALLFSLLIGWFASLPLAFINPGLISSLRVSARCKQIHWLIWIAFVSAGLLVYAQGLSRMEGEAWIILICGVPLLAVSQFAVLLTTHLYIWRKRRRSEQQ